MQRFDVVVIGGGIVGMATALAIGRGRPGTRIAVLEKEAEVGRHQSGRNSGVIHSGVYYRPVSLKARLCVEGAEAMLEFCRVHALPHSVCGKVIVATRDEERPRLEELHRRGVANGVPGLALIGPERLREIEPHAAGLRALHIPTTAVTDYRAVTAAMARLVQETGGTIRTKVRVTGLARRDGATVIESTAEPLAAAVVVNCAGLFSDRIARFACADDGTAIVPFRGEYRALAPERGDLVRALIYPVPDPRFPFLDIHLTRTVHGAVEAGPNAVLALSREGYRWSVVSPADLAATLRNPGFLRLARTHWRRGLAEMHRSLYAPAFLRAARRLLPALRPGDLLAGGSGVRAQAIDRSGRLLDDFHIVRGPGAVHVLNAPSPAATASLPIGRHIAAMVLQALP